MSGSDTYGDAWTGSEDLPEGRKEAPREDLQTPSGVGDADGADGTAGLDSGVASDSTADVESESPEAEAIEGDLAELLRQAESQRDEYLDLARRAQADFENFRKRAGKDVAQARERGVSDVLHELLPVVDNLERAIAAAEDPAVTDAPPLAEGVRLVLNDLNGMFVRLGVERIDAEGKPFDPSLHEAITTRAEAGVEPGVVLDVAQHGYTRNENVLRPARVVVSS